MKAKYLKTLLNTGYHVHNGRGQINVGSSMCSALISMDTTTFRIRYALAFPDSRKFSRESIDHQPLLDVWDGLQRLVDSGEIHEVISGNDEYPEGVPVFFERDGQIIESVTDVVEWPHTTREGDLIYTNTHFATREEAIRRAIEDYKIRVKWGEESLEERRKELAERESRLLSDKDRLACFCAQLPREVTP